MTAPADRTAEPPAVHTPAPPAGAEPTLVAPVPGVGSPTPAAPALARGQSAAGPDAGGSRPREGSRDPLATKRKRRPKDIGTAAETAVVRYLQANGWPGAERRALRGTSDVGDITGTPGVAWEVKSRNRPVTDKQVDAWLRETFSEAANAHADVGILVIRRPGHGPANAGSWWAISTAMDLFHIHGGAKLGLNLSLVGAYWTSDIPVRLTLAHMVRLLRLGGWGDPIEGDPLEDS